MNIQSDSTLVRAGLVEALRLDLVGPDNDHIFAHELLPESPTRWYLTGFLVPRHAPEEQRNYLVNELVKFMILHQISFHTPFTQFQEWMSHPRNRLLFVDLPELYQVLMYEL